jgi:hypothetical protein
MLSLCTRLNPIQPMVNGKVDCLVVAGFKMQAGVMFYTAPIASKERV